MSEEISSEEIAALLARESMSKEMTNEEAIEILKYSIGLFPVTDRAVSALDMAIKALEQKSMSKEMTREEAIEELSILLNKYQDGNIGDALDMAMTVLEQEPKTGRWIEHEIEGLLRYLECSNCHYETYNVKHNYCMNCGAKMDVEEKSCSNGK